MENKKISFGFSKTAKKTELLPKAIKNETKIELIDCLEGQSIKIKDAVEEVHEPLIIPLVNTTKNIADRIKEVREKREKQEIERVSEVLDSDLTIDELAARELIREAQNRDKNGQIKVETVAPIEETDKFLAEGAEQSTLDDYESIPIAQFGMAMLKGMGWKEGMPIGKRAAEKNVPPALPELRPKGLGLGAYKMINKDRPKEKATDENGKELKLSKNGYCKVISGRHKGCYGQIDAFDENCRVVIKTSTGDSLNLNDYLLVPVTQKEYSLGSKIINNVKYEQYKSEEQEGAKPSQKNTHKHEKSRQRSRSRSRERRRDSSRSKKDKSSSNKSRSESKRHRSRERSHRR